MRIINCQNSLSRRLVLALTLLPVPVAAGQITTSTDTLAVSLLAKELADDELKGRQPYTSGNEKAARLLASELAKLGAVPLIGKNLLVPFTTPDRSKDTLYNVAGVIPGRGGELRGDRLIGITSHFDHLGIGPIDSNGDSIYNGFLDAAVPLAVIIDLARRYSVDPGQSGLAILFFNLEEEGLLGSSAFLDTDEGRALVSRLSVLIGLDAGAPAGEPLEWQIMGGAPLHPAAKLADSLAGLRGWKATITPIRPISDVYLFGALGVPILFPIPGSSWRDYTESERAQAMARFDHYHSPKDEWRPDFPWTGTMAMADWIWDIITIMSNNSKQNTRP